MCLLYSSYAYVHVHVWFTLPIYCLLLPCLCLAYYMTLPCLCLAYYNTGMWWTKCCSPWRPLIPSPTTSTSCRLVLLYSIREIVCTIRCCWGNLLHGFMVKHIDKSCVNTCLFHTYIVKYKEECQSPRGGTAQCEWAAGAHLCAPASVEGDKGAHSPADGCH